jgi:hypothetical protein
LVFLDISWDFRCFLRPWRHLFATITLFFISSLTVTVYNNIIAAICNSLPVVIEENHENSQSG